MNKITKCLAFLALIVGSSNAVAQSATVGSGSGGPNDVVVIPVNFATGALGLGAFDLDISFDGTKFSAASANCAVTALGQNTSNCSGNAGSNKLRISVVANPGIPLTAGLAANLSFTLAPGVTPGNIPLDGAFFSITGIDFSEPEPSGFSVTDGNISVDGPEFSSNPASGGGTEFIFGPVVQNAALASQNLTITNTGVGTLSGECTEGADAGNVFTVTNGAYSAGAGLNDTVTVACNSAGAIATHTGSMSCTHNGGNVASPVEYQFSCQITDGPKAAFSSSNPSAGGPIDLEVDEAGDPDPFQTLTITNSGDATTTLTGSCAVSGDPQITVNSTAQFNILQGAAGVQRTVTCDASVQGNYTGTLSCTHNGSNASPVEYAVSCTVPEAGSAVFASNPDPSSTIELDDGTPVVKDSEPPKKTLTFFNQADPGDQNLGVKCVFSGSSDGEISADPVDFSDSIVPGGSASVEFSCDTSATGTYTATYDCTYGNAGVDSPMGEGSLAFYNLSCDVRDPEAEVEITPVPGAPQNKSVPPGGSTSFTFDFTEVNDEGEDGSLISCALDSGAQGFTISEPSFPTDIISGNTVTVVVGFTDPTGADSYTDTLACMFSDTNSDDVEVTWPLTVTIGGDARFTVLKDFTDDNPGEVTVDLDCDTGLILDQEKTITEDGIGVTFVVTDFDAGELNCNVTERPVAGYRAEFDASGDSGSDSIDDPNEDAGCYFSEVDGGDENLCEITNQPLPVDVVITKEWLYPGSADATSVSDHFELEMVCFNAVIEEGNKCLLAEGATSEGGQDDFYTCLSLSGNGNEVFTVPVKPIVYPGGSCYVVERDTDQAVEVDNGCAGEGQGMFVLEVSAGSGDSCTITNTVFFEGIPTLSQYGMALMALLMLGMGFVAVRRIV